MLSTDENMLLCNIEPGAPMHEAFKRYWLPVGLSSDLPEPDSDPRRVTLLGEDYVLFRDSEGTAALMRERCCHRGASLMLGRVEEGGIRCIYHGWKFSADGTILDMPNCQDEKFKTRYRQPSFPVREAGTIIWAYVGPAEHKPPFPDYPFFEVPDSHVNIDIPVFGGNYMQVMEGGLDSSHLGILHADTMGRAASEGSDMANISAVAGVLVKQRAPYFEVEETDYGCRMVAVRDIAAPDGTVQSVARVTAFQLPAVCYIAPDNTMLFAAPVNNGVTHFYHIAWKWDAPYTPAESLARRAVGNLTERGMIQFGMSRDRFGKPGTAMRENNWLQDRDAMRAGTSFTGLVNFIPEDAAVTASAGPIYDRRDENLVPADIGLGRVRRVLSDNARRIQAGEPARGLVPETAPRPAMGVIGPDRRWQDIPYRSVWQAELEPA
jgi:phthalate 4,5-dioxygenase